MHPDSDGTQQITRTDQPRVLNRRRGSGLNK
jgi:hypothetical protein